MSDALADPLSLFEVRGKVAMVTGAVGATLVYDTAPFLTWLMVVGLCGALFGLLALRASGIGFLMMFAYLLHSLLKGKKAPANPWGSRAMEWQVSSPPPLHNFEHTPVIINGPYDYHKPMSEFQLGIASSHNGHYEAHGHDVKGSETVKEKA
jgi:heme/copper-type cytochrome/quinol oxidase subunit 1